MVNSQFRFCPACASSRFVENDFKSRRCEACGFTYYFNVAASVAAFIVDDQGRLLVARRAHEPAQGTLDLPGGFVDPGDTLETAILREIMEETHLHLARPVYLFSLPNTYHYSGINVLTADAFFLLEAGDTSALCPADDVAELFFLEKSEIDPESFGLDSIRQAVRRWLNDE
ncbi:NUDIX domain-containing protein [Bacteroidales bacterium OttesenSCG-928-L03]|nr:NUDIX domain-containing protein [Bacteroidales bacterium OttesenSCG-928-L03]